MKARRKKVVLYFPMQADADQDALVGKENLPLSLLTISAFPLEDGYDVQIIDGNLYPQEEAHRRVLDACEGALLYGTTGILGYQVTDGYLCSQKVRARFPELPSVIGGWFASAAPELQLRTGFYDAVALGQGEITFRELVAAVDAGEPLDDIPGLALLRDNEVVFTPHRAVVGWNVLRNCPWHLIDFEDYRRHQLSEFNQRLNERLPRPPWIPHPKRFVSISYFSSFGCPEKCAFCCSPEVTGARWKAMPAPRMLDDLAELHDRWGFDNVGFYDANWGVAEKRARNFAEGMIERGLRFGYFATLQTFSVLRYSDESLDLLAKSGLYGVNIGGETGSQEMIDRIQKHIELGDDLAAARRLDDRGILTEMGFIIGYPGESVDSMYTTLDRARAVRAACNHSNAKVYPFMPIPATAFWEQALADGFEPPESLVDWGDFESYRHSPKWSTRLTPDVLRRHGLYNHYATLSEGVVRGKIGWWEKRAQHRMRTGDFRFGLLEARAFALTHRISKRLAPLVLGAKHQPSTVRYRELVPPPWEANEAEHASRC